MKSLTGRMRRAMEGPELQNIPAPKSADHERSMALRRSYHGSFANFMVQMEGASRMAALHWQGLLDEGYVEVIPGMMVRSPDGKTEVWNG